ncbi:outer membrane protein assembly factor BamE [Amaricoccus sp.]|uniref:outer membrane protein assembly factor BamE domain-containing protein n=1 Tax=Amaricoccus sp. TaxID=1872485 RepID=UPI001B464A0F|nr:outer membrane protein assembly factor BamE [Amaricoccus sp.]MBP7240480.1 outer membrane protein assembly factor BamE [Amaricoccus sp.]
MRSKALRHTAICVLVLGLAAACAPTTQVHGYVPPAADVAAVTLGVDTTATVEEKLGLPSSTGLLQDSAWFYVQSTIRHFTYHRPNVVDRTVLVVSFNADGVVTGIESYGLDRGRIVELEARTTDTGGRQLGVLEQLFGNLLNLDATQFENQ